MKTIFNTCEAFTQTLIQACQQSHIIRNQVKEFTTNVLVFPLTMVKLRLKLILCQIMVWVSSLQSQHEGKGSVFIMLTHRGLGVYWSEREYSREDKEWFKFRGSLITSPEALCQVIEQFEDQLEAGNWVEPVEWINRYGTCLISDADKYCGA